MKTATVTDGDGPVSSEDNRGSKALRIRVQMRRGLENIMCAIV